MVILYDEYAKIDELNEYIKKHGLELTEYEKEKLDTWKKEQMRIVSFETEEQAEEYLKEYLVNNWMLQNFKTNFLVDNVKPQFDTIEYDTMFNIIKAIQEKDDANTTNNLLQIVDIDELIYNALSQDGIGLLMNYYDGVDIELISKELNDFITITAL